MLDNIKESLIESAKVFQKCADELPDEILAVAQKIAMTITAGKKIMFCGNGGSAADGCPGSTRRSAHWP